jgi:uncharacterized membrane protein YhfC
MNPIYLFQGISIVFIVIMAMVYWKKRSQITISFFLWGGLSWFLAMVLKSIASAPMPQIIPRLRELSPTYIAEPLLWLTIGLLTGIFECGITLLLVSRLKRLRSATWEEALGYGLGFGGLEALLLGIYNFVIVLLIIVIPDQLPQELVDLADPSKASLLAIPIPIFERAIVILLHVFSSILIIYAVQKKECRWFWFSFLYKTAMDTIAGFIQITYGLENLSLAGLWLVELILLPFGLIGIWGLMAFRSRWQEK